MWRRFISQLLCCCLLAGATPAVAADGNTERQQHKEYQAKALFLYNFANFVFWPDDAFDRPDAPIRLCLFGNVPFGTFLDEVNGTLIGNQPLSVIRAQSLRDINEGCHILFVGDDKKAKLPDLFTRIEYLYVLSVGEQSGFTESGGIINILRTSDRVQFEVNISNAVKNGLFISSDLLALAREIRRHTEQQQQEQQQERQ